MKTPAIFSKTHSLIQTGMKTLTTVLLMGAVTAASAQCVTSSLIVNTGYTPTGPIAAGSNDPHWQVVALSTNLAALSLSPAPPFAAVGTNTGGWGASNANSSWISLYNPVTWYATTALPDDYSMTLRREFSLCQDDDIRVSLQVARDNWIRNLTVDGIPVFSDPAGQNTAFFNSFTAVPAIVLPMTAGTHNIEVEVVDFHDRALPNQANPHALNLVGTVTSASGSTSIIDDNNCGGYVCDDGCSDECFWKLSGNNIANNKNFFGTRTPHDVRIMTSNVLRGIFTQNGLFGWNTMTPTAYMHVLCTGNNPDDGSAGSDVRFENLEPGSGNVLVIDAAGYVYDSRMRIGKDGTVEGMAELKERVAQLEAMVQQLSVKDVSGPAANGNSLGQNVPNPFGKETMIEYNVQTMTQNAFIMISDLNGRQISRHAISTRGKGTVTVNSESMVPGVYMYSLVVDGREISSKRMVLSK